MTGMPNRYHVPLETFHYKWSRSHKPALSVKEGDTVTFEINDVGSWQLNKDSTSEDVLRFDTSKLYPLAGPVFVEGAEPATRWSSRCSTSGSGTSGGPTSNRGSACLRSLRKPFLYKWDLKKSKRSASFENGIKIPLKPFCGVLGSRPAVERLHRRRTTGKARRQHGHQAPHSRKLGQDPGLG